MEDKQNAMHRLPDWRTTLPLAQWAPRCEAKTGAGKRGGRPRRGDVREVLNAVFYVLSTGCQWQALPKDLPPKSTAWDYVSRWEWEGTIERIHHALCVAVREQAGREASPTTAIIDSHTAKTALNGARHLIRPATMPARKSWAASAIC